MGGGATAGMEGEELEHGGEGGTEAEGGGRIGEVG